MEKMLDEDVPSFCSCSYCLFVQKYFQFLVYPLAFLMIPLKVEQIT
jgi:hypothetical protein